MLFKRGLAYRSTTPINWCPSCKTGLANEEVKEGRCWRCDSPVEKRPMPQWYFKIDRYPPGLFLPSTVEDYSHWHGDYHTNYNLQEPFWGDYTSNHLDTGDAYFKAMEPIFEVGRKIARDYYGTRGTYVQLSAYPMKMDDDPLGCVPMGRMAYMTGWCANQYWWRYTYTLDKEWLRATGYPAIRDCALFYTDFLKKGDDGFYHAFPSNQGEDGFSNLIGAQF